MKFSFKKIASVIATTALLGSTLGFAAAATYPAPFVSDGAGNGAIVVGSTAHASDTTKAVELGTSLSAMVTKTTTTTSGEATGGDSYLLKKPSNNINLGDTITSVFGSTVTYDHLTDLLAKGTYRDNVNADHDYEQKITMGSNLQLLHWQDSDYDEDETPTIGINISSGEPVMNYTLDFISNPDWLENTLESSDIKILGKDYYILEITNSSNTDHKLTLLDAANTINLNEGETKTVTIGDKTYEVKINFISTSQVKLEVNGEITSVLANGDTYKLKDDTYLGVKEILARDVQGHLGIVEFSIGSGKLELINGQTVEFNDDSVMEITSYVSVSSGDLDSITLEWKPEDGIFLTPESELVMPGFESVKFTMSDLVESEGEVITVEGAGGTSNGYIVLKTPIKNADINLPLLYANASGEFVGLGKDATHKLVTSNETEGVVFNVSDGADAMIVSWASTTDYESYLIDIDSISYSDGINQTTVKVKNKDSWTEYKDKRIGDSVNLGSLSLTIDNIVRTGSKGSVTFNGSSGTSFNKLYTEGGLRIDLPWLQGTKASEFDNNSSTLGNGEMSFNYDVNLTAGHGPDTFYLYMDEANKDGTLGAGTEFYVTIDDKSDNSIEVSAVSTGSQNLEESDDNDNTVSRVQSDLATKVRHIGASDSQREAEITYYGEEVYAEIYVAASSVSITPGEGSTGSIKVVKDSEVDSVKGLNLIVVGGSCVNTVAAELLGSETPVCGDDFTAKTQVGAGQYLIKVYNSPYATADSGRIAMLVAGYNAPDTENAVDRVIEGGFNTDVTTNILGPTTQ